MHDLRTAQAEELRTWQKSAYWQEEGANHVDVFQVVRWIERMIHALEPYRNVSGAGVAYGLAKLDDDDNGVSVATWQRWVARAERKLNTSLEHERIEPEDQADALFKLAKLHFLCARLVLATRSAAAKTSTVRHHLRASLRSARISVELRATAATMVLLWSIQRHLRHVGVSSEKFVPSEVQCEAANGTIAGARDLWLHFLPLVVGCGCTSSQRTIRHKSRCPWLTHERWQTYLRLQARARAERAAFRASQQNIVDEFRQQTCLDACEQGFLGCSEHHVICARRRRECTQECAAR